MWAVDLDARERLILILDLAAFLLGAAALATGGAPIWMGLSIAVNLVNWAYANGTGGILDDDEITHLETTLALDSLLNGFGVNAFQRIDFKGGLRLGVFGDLVQFGLDYNNFASS